MQLGFCKSKILRVAVEFKKKREIVNELGFLIIYRYKTIKL